MAIVNIKLDYRPMRDCWVLLIQSSYRFMQTMEDISLFLAVVLVSALTDKLGLAVFHSCY